MRDLELQHCHEMKSDFEDELHIAGLTIEQFDNENVEFAKTEQVCWQGESNISHDSNPEGQLVELLQPPSLLVLRSCCSESSSSLNLTDEAHLEIVQKMRTKMQSICEQLGSLHDKIR